MPWIQLFLHTYVIYLLQNKSLRKEKIQYETNNSLIMHLGFFTKI